MRETTSWIPTVLQTPCRCASLRAERDAEALFMQTATSSLFRKNYRGFRQLLLRISLGANISACRNARCKTFSRRQRFARRTMLVSFRFGTLGATAVLPTPPALDPP